MKKLECRSVQSLLGPYVDGELTGADRLCVSHHLQACRACAGEVDALGNIGDLLRRSTADDEASSGMDAFASNIVTRVRAESAVSWAARFERAVGDSRLLWVGTGSVLGAMATMLVVAAALFVGQVRVVPGDLEGLGQVGRFLAIGQAEDRPNGDFLVDYSARQGSRVITEPMLAGPSEVQIVSALADLITRHGRLVALADMSPEDREQAMALLDEYIRRQMTELVRVELLQLRLHTTADVSANGL
ncbi:MAG TPA: zf-HC2 domain-containing protein [Vicinamibacterales bacterium]|nr:zf-HC2 domain-containing protein [Vicinamibacterales bacterium]